VDGKLNENRPALETATHTSPNGGIMDPPIISFFIIISTSIVV
jgi:hypothetical protein